MKKITTSTPTFKAMIPLIKAYDTDNDNLVEEYFDTDGLYWFDDDDPYMYSYVNDEVDAFALLYVGMKLEDAWSAFNNFKERVRNSDDNYMDKECIFVQQVTVVDETKCFSTLKKVLELVKEEHPNLDIYVEQIIISLNDTELKLLGFEQLCDDEDDKLWKLSK